MPMSPHSRLYKSNIDKFFVFAFCKLNLIICCSLNWEIIWAMKELCGGQPLDSCSDTHSGVMENLSAPGVDLFHLCWLDLFLAAPGMKILPTAGGVVISQTPQVYQPHIIVQPSVPVNRLIHYIQHLYFCFALWWQPNNVASDAFQALPLGQQLETKPPTGPLAGVETVPMPVATVSAASIPAASTAAASGQAPPTNGGTIALGSYLHLHS